MYFSISRDQLLQPLHSISGAVEKRQTLAILSHIYIDVSDSNRLTLIGTDLEVEVKVTTDLDSDVEAGTTTIPARKFFDLCKALPEESNISVKVEDNRCLVRSGKSRFTLSTLSADEYPSVEDIDPKVTINELSQSVLKRLLQKTHFAMAQQDVRYYLNGLLLEIEESELRLVATDGHRLSFAQRNMNDNYGSKQQVIIPRKAVQEILRLLSDSDDPLSIVIGANHIQFSLGSLTLISKLIDGRYPDYDRVIPREGDRTLVTDKNALKSAISRVSILSNEKYRGIRMLMNDQVVAIHANNPDQEEAEEELQVSYNGEAMEIGFNSAYMFDALSVVDSDDVTIYFIDENSSSLIHIEEGESNFKFVVMPMRL